MNKTILLAEDDQRLSKSMANLLENTDYDFLYGQTQESIKETLASNPVDLVIVDLRFSNDFSYDLLKHIKEHHPKVIRIALSDYSDNKMLYDAVDSNLARVFLYKPWKDQEMILFFEKLFSMEEKLHDEDLLNVIKSIDNLPTIPSLYLEINKMVEEHQSVFDITKVIEKDQAIASRVLKIANSAFYCAKTGDIKQAIMFIGLTNVKNIILTHTVYASTPENKRRLSVEWEHAALTNKIINASFEEFISYKLQNTYKSAGLLHNIGKAIVATQFPDYYKDLDIESALPCHMQEEKIIGTNHQMLGGFLLDWWDLPFPIIETALYHHDPLNPSIINTDLVQMIHLADYYAWQLLDYPPREVLIEEVFDRLRISKEHYEAFIDAFKNNAM